jgi:type VI secretion system secreted protein VgrG
VQTIPTEASYYRARYYDPTIGRFTREDPLRFGAGSPNFYGYVYQNPTNFTDPSGRVVVYGNWCGPSWTGGKEEPFNPKHMRDYKQPIDGLDETCMHHDICYFNCRSTLPCDKGGRRKCMRQCDKLFVAEVPTSNGWLGPSGDQLMAWYGIALHIYPSPGANACGCKE